MDAAGFVAGQAAQATIDGLAFEPEASALDLGDDLAARELSGAGAPMEPLNGTKNGISTTPAAMAILA